MISGRSMHFDRNRGVGTAKHVILRIKKVPILYLPYLRFPIDNRRLTGFLMPSVSISKEKGQSIGLPFYWSMAPNYDMTITPAFNFKRGFEIKDLFRYLTTRGRGKLSLAYLPYDRGFKSYRAKTIDNSEGDSDLTTFVDKLRKMHNYRGFVGFDAKEKWDNQWSSEFHLNYVTDPYFFRDVGNLATFLQPDQLLNELTLKYSGSHWQLNSMVQAYQTLHRIDAFDQAIYNQYERLPQFDAGANYPDIWKNLNWNMSSEAVNFEYNSAFPTQFNTLPTPVGQRFHFRPSLDYDNVWSAGYIDPQLSIDSTNYFASFQQTSQSGTRSEFNQSRVMPIVDIDSGLYFDRRFKFHDEDYIQTLEPRLFYLWVPYKNQAAYPDFDTELLPFSYASLFDVNRFSGFDRIENANQFSLGLNSRVIDSDTGAQRLEMGLGIIYYMERQKISLPGVTLNNDRVSPLVGNLTYSITNRWSANAQAAWDFSREQFNNTTTGLTYTAGNNKLFNFGYTYVSAPGASILGISNSTSQVYAGAVWPLFYHIAGFGYVRYNFSGNFAQGYMAGLQYDSCCWALRLLYDREFTGRAPYSTVNNIKNEYNDVYSVQIELKGLASVGNNTPTALLQNHLPGYKDPFSSMSGT
ncbi:MAG: hypothetical protein COB66_09155 [Coxiella sp. (in: Bacteria)]|nr:MAG: hypothetical protein COB66_09155 [Coxiella sp. (in: g-proteobacteria)]